MMITQLDIVKNFTYKDGHLYWKKARSGIQVNNCAGCIDSKGYLRIKFNGKKYLNHRLIYLMHYGYLPKMLDHIDNNRSNNKIENLRPATRSENLKNTLLRCDNSSGHKNVQFHAPTNKWKVSLRVNGKKKHIGLYDDIEIAALVADEARKLHNGVYANKRA